jgi:hypothetical protein
LYLIIVLIWTCFYLQSGWLGVGNAACCQAVKDSQEPTIRAGSRLLLLFNPWTTGQRDLTSTGMSKSSPDPVRLGKATRFLGFFLTKGEGLSTYVWNILPGHCRPLGSHPSGEMSSIKDHSLLPDCASHEGS